MGLIPYKNEAYLDWSDENNVEAMRAALERRGLPAGPELPRDHRRQARRDGR